MKLNGNTSKRSAAARREAADFAAQERSAHRSGANPFRTERGGCPPRRRTETGGAPASARAPAGADRAPQCARRPAAPAPKAKKPRGRGGRIAVRVVLIVLAVLVAAGALGMVLVAKKSAIFPERLCLRHRRRAA